MNKEGKLCGERADLYALLSNGRASSSIVKNTLLFIYFTLPSSHCRKSFLLNSPIISIRSAVVRSWYNRMTCPHTLHKSSHSTSNNSHQQFSGFEGNDIPSRRVVSRIAALTTVGTAYRAYTGVCNLLSVTSESPKESISKNARVIEVAPCHRHRLIATCQPKQPHVVDQSAVWQHHLHVESQPL